MLSSLVPRYFLSCFLLGFHSWSLFVCVYRITLSGNFLKPMWRYQTKCIHKQRLAEEICRFLIVPYYMLVALDDIPVAEQGMFRLLSISCSSLCLVTFAWSSQRQDCQTIFFSKMQITCRFSFRREIWNGSGQLSWHCHYWLIDVSHLFIGDITQKGYEKKRSRILAPYIPHSSALGKQLSQEMEEHW